MKSRIINMADIEGPEYYGGSTERITILHKDGSSEVIKAHPNRIRLEVRGKAIYEYYYFPNGVEGEDPSDVIQFRTKPYNSDEWTGWLMNVEDVMQIIAGISLAANYALLDGLPVGPQE